MLKTRRDPAVDDGWTSETSSGFALAGFLGVVFVIFTLLAMGPLSSFDAYFNLSPPPPAWLPVLHILDHVGQRAIAVTILGIVTYRVCRQIRSWRPALLVVAGVLAQNFVVGVLKLSLGRDSPESANPSFFTGGMAYPSGHSSNVIMVYGLLAYVVLHYSNPGRRTRAFLWSLVPVLSVVMVFTSLTLHWHWFSDLLSGLIIGGAVLQLTVAVDRSLPDPEPGLTWPMIRAWLHVWLRMLRIRRSRGPAGPG